MKRAIVTLLAALLAAPALAADPPVATVGSKTITRADLEKQVAPQLQTVEQQRFDIMREGLEVMISESLVEQEAAAKKVKPEELMKVEVMDKVPAPSDAEISAVYEENKAQLQGATLEQVKPRIVEYLNATKMDQRRQEYIAELKKKYKTTVALKPPRIEVAKGDRPPLGKKDAPITIVMFSDYECPFCKRSEPTVEMVMEKYKDKVQLYYRDYPLPFHQNAKPASEAAHCANAQGKFWEYHKKVMAAEDLSKANLQKIASDVGLDRKKFDECLDKGTFRAAVEAEAAAGQEIGIDGTPAFFINGRRLTGAQPYEKFQEIIDEELAGS